MECHALNLRVAYVDRCVNVSGRALLPISSPAANVTHPYRDQFGDGRWLRAAYLPGRHDPLSDAELLRQDRELGVRLRRDASETLRLGSCSRHGLLTPLMPWKSPPAGRARSEPACHCFPGWFGEQVLPHPQHYSQHALVCP